MNAYLDQLTAPRQELIKLTGVRILERSHRRPDGAGEGRQHGGVHAVGLGQLPRGTDEVARLTGIDDGKISAEAPLARGLVP